jgi:hypothetical protein
MHLLPSSNQDSKTNQVPSKKAAQKLDSSTSARIQRIDRANAQYLEASQALA